MEGAAVKREVDGEVRQPGRAVSGGRNDTSVGEISVKTGNNARNGGKNSLNRLIRCVCGKKIGPDPRNFNQRVNLGRNDLLIRTFLSCLNDDLTLLRIILPAKPDLNCVTRFGGVGLTPACEKGHLSIVKELLAHTEINVNQTNHVGWTPLLEAIVLNDGGIKQQAIVQLLLEHGASPHLTDKYGKTPLELARERGFEEIAQLLIAAGA